MNLFEECNLSYYEEVGEINKEHHVSLVRHAETGKFFVKKSCRIYNPDMYAVLRDHPVKGMPRIHELFETEDGLVIIEEYLSGDTLEQMIEKHGPFTEAEALPWFIELCGIVARLHAFVPPIVHRDIKPTNIIVSPDGSLKLLDLSAARQSAEEKTQDTVIMGTAGYAAPEQYGFTTSSPATDIYAIGIVMNKILTGKMLSESRFEGGLGRIIAKCTQLNPKERYKSVILLADDLRAYSARRSVDVSEAETQDILPEKKAWRKYLPPGFRSGKPWAMILAMAGYALLISLCVTLTTKDSTPYKTAVNRIFITLMFAVIVLFSGNYLGMQSMFPLANSKKTAVRILGIILWDFVFMICALVFITVLAG